MTVYSNTALQHCIQQDYRCECAVQCTGRNKQNRTWMIIPSRAHVVLTAILKGWNLRAVRYIKPIDEIEVSTLERSHPRTDVCRGSNSSKSSNSHGSKTTNTVPFPRGQHGAIDTFHSNCRAIGRQQARPPPLFLYKLKVTSPRAPGRTPKPSRPA